ncbi:ATP-binding cassette domain-containing protein [Pelagovum pacificum]|uniref:ATP-binding cassette domain-containing protein n=1 Tax=Pelagovum pacificum TaxID=2588711 RepID=A0A5C5GB87_9RHOB|nr:ATP-binding cassette domain-containing protein [Pelagovum pacificum]QQA41567.1 ATP-binding cassette domain-containing protein [Pelagovum pacificum]TNY30847.1 ATP-binding cassette domain-containing protein [Pelagovum pacificum]
MLTARAVSKAYGDRQILTGVDLDLAEGDVVGLGGASGSGKTTLGKVLAARLAPDHGDVLLEGVEVAPATPGHPAPLQYAPQSPELAIDPRWPVRKVLANGMPPDPEVLAALGIRNVWADRLPMQLSGGELARVSLARLFHPHLRVLICDEITSQLDAIEQDLLLRALVELAARRRISLLLISHSSALRSRFCRRSMVLDRRDDSKSCE